jgi:hypothetical protein
MIHTPKVRSTHAHSLRAFSCVLRLFNVTGKVLAARLNLQMSGSLTDYAAGSFDVFYKVGVRVGGGHKPRADPLPRNAPPPYPSTGHADVRAYLTNDSG